MWKPNEVVHRHKRRATLLWVILLLGMGAFIIRLLYKAFKRQENPSTSFTLSNKRYVFPDVTVCVGDNAGCDSYNATEGNYGDDCALSSLDYSGFYYANVEAGDDRLWNATINEYHHGCVDFNLSDITVAEVERSRADTTTASIGMFWTVAETDEDVNELYREFIFVYLDDSAAITVPYSRVHNENQSLADLRRTALAIGLTEKSYLKKDKESFYYPTTIATTTTRSAVRFEADVAVGGALILDVTQAFFSLTIVDEINPFAPLELLGSVGGFWEILLLMWGLFFVASSKPEPGQKARNFVKSYKRGVGTAKVIKKAASMNHVRCSRTVRVREGNEKEVEEEDVRPQWDTTHSTSGQTDQEARSRDDNCSAKYFHCPVVLSGPKSSGHRSGTVSSV